MAEQKIWLISELTKFMEELISPYSILCKYFWREASLAG